MLKNNERGGFCDDGESTKQIDHKEGEEAVDDADSAKDKTSDADRGIGAKTNDKGYKTKENGDACYYKNDVLDDISPHVELA